MSTPQTPESALRMLRVIWAAMLLGIIAMSGLVLTFAGGQQNNADPAFNINHIQLGLLIGMVATVALAHVIRLQVYKRHWSDYAILPQGYFLGNLILFALLEGFVMVNLVLILISHQVAPLALPGGIVLILLVINFPTGSIMLSNRRLS